MPKHITINKIITITIGIALLAAGCQKAQLKQEAPSSPRASYQELPK